MTPRARRTPGSSASRLALIALGLAALAGCAAPDVGSAAEDTTPLESLAPDALHWVTPLTGDVVRAGDPVDVTAYTQRQDLQVMHFAVDGEEVGACDAGDAEQDCNDGDHWTWSVVFDTAGTHRLTASTLDATGAALQIERDVTVRAADTSDPSTEPSGDPSEADPIPSDQQIAEGTGQISQGVYSDPDEPMGPAVCHRTGAHACATPSVTGCQSWAVQGGRVVLPAPARIDGSTDEIDRCMQDYGAAIGRYADLRYVSRASIAAWLAATGNCDPCMHWNRGLISGARCVATARARGLHLSTTECLARVNADGHDFAIDIATEFLHRTRGVHHHDPVLEAAYLHHGAHPQRGDINTWCAGAGASSGAFVTHYVAAYNAYLTWSHQPHVDASREDTHLCVGYAGWNDPRIFSDAHYDDVYTRSSGLANARLCHAYARFDLATLPASHPDRAYFDTWLAAAEAEHCEVSVAFKASNQQYTPEFVRACDHAHACPAHQGCGSNGYCQPRCDNPCPTYRHCESGSCEDINETCAAGGRCEHHAVPGGRSYEDAFVAFRRAYPSVHVFSTWNEPNNNAGLESSMPPEQFAEFYLRARRNCRPRDRCYLTAGDVASWYVVDPTTGQTTVDWMGGVAMACRERDGSVTRDPDHLCSNGGFLDRFKYAIVHDEQAYGFHADFRPEFFGFHPWHDSLAYGHNGARCDATGNCMTRALLDSLGGSWSGAQLWATEAGVIDHAVSCAPTDATCHQPDFGRACDASFLINLFGLSPRIARFYLFDAGSIVGSGHTEIADVLRNRNEAIPASCN